MSSRHKPEGALWAPTLGSVAFEGFCQMFFTFYCPLSVEGRERLPDGPFLLCSNHSSHADSAALMTATGRRFQGFAMLGASDYFIDSRKLRWLVGPGMNLIPIERQPGPKSLTSCIAICRQFLDETGGILILYPEGTRSLDGRMGTFKSGAGLFATELGVPLVPAYVEGTHHVLPKGRSIPHPGHVRVRFGEVLSPASLSSSPGLLRDQRRSVVEQLERSVRSLAGLSQPEELVAPVQEKG